jgi:integrase
MGDVALQSLTAEHVERFQAAKLAEGKAPATVRQYRVLIIACLEAAVQRGYIPRNVGKLAGSFRSPPPIIRCMDAAQARTFLEAAHSDRFYALYLIALTLGLRKGELLALRWQDVDLDKATLSVNGSMQRIEGREVRVETKTAHSNRTLRLTPQIVDALKVRRDVQQFEAHIDEGWQDTGYIFTSRFGTSAGRENILTYFQAILKRAGLPKVTMHSLRHSAATLALMSGVPIHVVSRMLGHASIVITLNRYAHLMPALEEQAVDILATMYA